MEYSEEFLEDLKHLEVIAMELAASRERGDVDSTQEHELAVALDHILNTYPIEYPALKQHIETVSRLSRTYDRENTMTKHVATVREIFLDDVCEDYDPVY